MWFSYLRLIHLALQMLVLTLPYKKDLLVLVSYIYKIYQKSIYLQPNTTNTYL